MKLAPYIGDGNIAYLIPFLAFQYSGLKLAPYIGDGNLDKFSISTKFNMVFETSPVYRGRKPAYATQPQRCAAPRLKLAPYIGDGNPPKYHLSPDPTI